MKHHHLNANEKRRGRFAIRKILILTCAAALSVVGCNPTASSNDGGLEAGDTHVPTRTYWRDVAPIVNAHCVGCHVEGGIAPMALDTYQAVRPAAASIVDETAAHIMPPWLPTNDASCRALSDTRNLTAAQIETFALWASDGAVEGNPADYVAPPPVTDALPPVGDVVVRPEQPYVPTIRVQTDDYHCFIMDPNLTTQHDIIGMRVTPGNAAIVHHMILFEVRESALAQLQALDDAEPGPGYTCFGSSGINPNYRSPPAGSPDLSDFDQQMVAAWAPGSLPSYFPAGTGIRLKPGSRLVMQVHYNLASTTVRGMSDQTRVDLYSSPTPVASQALFIPISQQDFTVPAGTPPTDPSATVTAHMNAPGPLRMFGVAPHMHLRGRSIRVDVTHPDNTNECLVDIPEWDFHWQQVYWFQNPMRMMAGAAHDVFDLSCTYDNTAANQPAVDGVTPPPHDLHWGDSTYDEMCINFFYVAL